MPEWLRLEWMHLQSKLQLSQQYEDEPSSVQQVTLLCEYIESIRKAIHNG